MEKLERSWQIMRTSWDVLKQDKEILVFPILSGLALILIMASFAVPIFALGNIDTIERIARHNGTVGNLVVAFAFYFINYFVIVFFNTAIVACATVRMRGGNPTVGDGLNAAGTRLFEIAGWALVSASVGLLLRAVEERSKLVGRIVAGLLGMAWGITSYLVIPILVNEKKGPMEAFQESARLLKKTWGEELIGGFSFGLIFFILALPAFGVLVAGFIAGKVITVILFILVVLYIIMLSVVQAALQGIFQAALYQYAIKGEPPRGFDRETLNEAITPRAFG
ncbi:MAG TPA: DUF6159 family protein [Syntrophales bacterium]